MTTSFASSDPTFPLFPIMSFLGFILPLVPLPWHLEAWNAGTCAFMIWTSMACLIEFVNSLVWKGNLLNPAPVWCDISTKLLLGASVGIPAASLCISHRLYKIAAVQTVTVSRSDKRNAFFLDLGITLGLPILVMILHVVVQGHRFDILEDIGCQPYIYNTLPAYFLFFMWAPLIGCVSFVFCALTLHCFWKRRIMFSEFSGNTSLSASRYMRLMALAAIEMMTTVPLGIYSIYLGVQGTSISPWISWSDTHYNFARVGLVPALYWRSDPHYEASVELTRWIYVVASLIFFGLFGFANEAIRNYTAIWRSVLGRFGVKPTVSKTGSAFSNGFGQKKGQNISGATSGSSMPPPPYPSSGRIISSPKKRRPDSLTSSLACDDDCELSELDIEKGLSTSASSVPPEYLPPHTPVTARQLEEIHLERPNTASSSASSSWRSVSPAIPVFVSTPGEYRLHDLRPPHHVGRAI